MAPYRETRPWLPRRVLTPHAAAGMRSEPPVSVPVATGTIRLASAAAEPPDEPPGVRRMSQGFILDRYRYTCQLPDLLAGGPGLIRAVGGGHGQIRRPGDERTDEGLCDGDPQEAVVHQLPCRELACFQQVKNLDQAEVRGVVCHPSSLRK
jgi:hypothetical protein